MNLRDLADSLLRRWVLVVVALAMTGGACWVARDQIPPTYETQATIVLLPPKSAIEPTANRFLDLAGLTQATDLLVRALNADATQEQVRRKASAGTYEVTSDPATSAPVVVITAKGSSAAEVEALVDVVLEHAPVSLSALQSSLAISRAAQITSIPLDHDIEPKVNQKSQLRAVAALGILLLFGSALLIGAIDGLLLVRAARKQPGSRGVEGAGGAAQDAAWLEELATLSTDVGAGKSTASSARHEEPGQRHQGWAGSPDRNSG